MKKILLFILVGLSVYLGYSFGLQDFLRPQNNLPLSSVPKRPILRVALVSDSHNENELLAKALEQAKGKGVNFVIGLGDWTNTGTIEELGAAKKVFDNSRLDYFVTAGDHDLWDSRDKQSLRSSTSSAGLKGEGALTNFNQVFGKSSQIIERENVLFVILDNSDIYKGISPEDWSLLGKSITSGQGTTSTIGNVILSPSIVTLSEAKSLRVNSVKNLFYEILPESDSVE